MTVLPVTWILSAGTLSASRFCRALSVGAKWQAVIAPAIRRFISSGQGE